LNEVHQCLLCGLFAVLFGVLFGVLFSPLVAIILKALS
jgi:hypothetical protein